VSLANVGVPVFVDPQDEVILVSSISEKDNTLFQSLIVKDLVQFAQEQHLQGKIVIAMHHTAPDLVRSAAWADYNIARTMWEMHDLPPRWVANIAQMDEVWVPSQFNRRTFPKAGVLKEKLFVVGECVDEDYYSPEVIHGPGRFSLNRKRRVNFFSLFNWNYRKGWDILIEAFAREFSPGEDVALFIKSFSSWGQQTEFFEAEAVRVLREKGIATSLPANIIFMSWGLQEIEMSHVYKAFDAFVLPTRAEGWGRPTMEAMLSGVPVITTKYSGQEEFVSEKTALVIAHKIVEVPPEAVKEVPNFAGGKWAEPSVEQLQKIMRKLATNPKEAKKKAKAAQNFVLEHFSTFKITSTMRDRLDEI